MNNPLKEVISSTGASSSMRVGMLGCVATACAIAIYTAYTGEITPDSNTLIVRLLICGFAGKAIQKFAEVK